MYDRELVLEILQKLHSTTMTEEDIFGNDNMTIIEVMV